MRQDVAFLEAIRERPESNTLRLIFADWLEEQGDPRGQFIRSQCAAARLASCSPRRLALESEANALLLRHEAEWLGPLLGRVSNWEWHRGLLRSITTTAENFLAHAAEWLPALPLLGVHLRQVRGHVAALAACPYLAHLNGLYLGDNGLTDDDLAVLLGSRHLRHLHTLYLHNSELTEVGIRALGSSSRLRQLRDLSVAMNRLREVGVQALAEATQLPRLRHLNLTMTYPGVEGLRALARSALMGRLRTLNLTNNLLPSGSLQVLTESPAFARMRTLLFDYNEGTDADTEALAGSPQVRQLRALLLASYGTRGERSLSALATSPNLGQLRTLAVGPLRCDRAGMQALGESRTLRALRALYLTADAEGMTDTAQYLLGGRLLRRLRVLSLEARSVGAAGLAALARHPGPLRLWRINLLLDEAKVEDWQALLARGSLSEATDLALSGLGPGFLECLPASAELAQLRRLSLWGFPSRGAAIGRLLECPLVEQLQHLELGPDEDFEGESIIEALTAPARWARLEGLVLGWTLTPAQVEALTKRDSWPLLTELNLGVFGMGRTGAKHLAQWPVLSRLRWLTLQNCSYQEVPGLEAFARSPHAGPLLRVDITNGRAGAKARPLLRERFGGRFAVIGRKLPRVVIIGGYGIGAEE